MATEHTVDGGDLVERLRANPLWPTGASRSLTEEAAALISSQKQEIAIAERNLDAARANFLTMQGAADTLRRRAETAESRVQLLEAENERLRKALDRIALATPLNTNSWSAHEAFSWTSTVAESALSGDKP